MKGIEKIWILFWMHEVKHWKVKVQPPRDVWKKGVFATRSPHRPNPIGLSCVTLIDVRGLDVFIKDHDLLDQTPILDIKPYVPADRPLEGHDRRYCSHCFQYNPLE